MKICCVNSMYRYYVQIYIFIAFLLTLCLFWTQIQIGKCSDELKFWSRNPKYWTETQNESTNRIPVTDAENDETIKVRRSNRKYIKNNIEALEGKFFGSDKESKLEISFNDNQDSDKNASENLFDPYFRSQIINRQANELTESYMNSQKLREHTIKNTTKPKKKSVHSHKVNKQKKGKGSKHHEKAIEQVTFKKVEEPDKADIVSDATVELTTETNMEPDVDIDTELSTEINIKAPTVTGSGFMTMIEKDVKITTNVEFRGRSIAQTDKEKNVNNPLRIDYNHMKRKKHKNDSTLYESKEMYYPTVISNDDMMMTSKSYNHINNILVGRSGPKGNGISSLKYLSPNSIKAQLKCLAQKFESRAYIDQEVIGRTVEYNDIVLWKMKEAPDNRKGFKGKLFNFRGQRGSKYADDKPEKNIIFIVHGLNVMGWQKLNCLSEVKRFETLLGYYIDNLDCFDIFLIPMANPDGVHLSENKGYWNKNVSPQKACPGVNLDRNFDIGWNASYSKTSSCSQHYPGPRPMSEHETRAIREVFNRYGHKMIGFFHIHSSTYDATVFKGDAVLYPKGYTDSPTEDDRYVDLKGELEETMRNTSFKVLGVTVDTMYSWYGKIIGSSVDYASSIFGIPYSFDMAMQIYEDDTMVTKEEDREQNTALVELWQIVLDVIFSHIHNSTDKPNDAN